MKLKQRQRLKQRQQRRIMANDKLTIDTLWIKVAGATISILLGVVGIVCYFIMTSVFQNSSDISKLGRNVREQSAQWEAIKVSRKEIKTLQLDVVGIIQYREGYIKGLRDAQEVHSVPGGN